MTILKSADSIMGALFPNYFKVKSGKRRAPILMLHREMTRGGNPEQYE